MNLTTEELKNIIKEELHAVLVEADDRCTRIAKSKYDVWPSAYASGAVVRCRDGKIWKDLKEEELSDEEKKELEAILRDEGGAAGMDPFEKNIDAAVKDIKKALEDNPEVGQHEDGDYILDDDEEIRVDKEDDLEEAVYQGREVPLNKPMAGDVKKSKVYVNSGKKDKEGRIVAKKVNFGHGGSSAKAKGEKTMKIRKNNPKARKNFRARHNCDNPGPKDKARYWSCKAW
jgi:hypothetical protein